MAAQEQECVYADSVCSSPRSVGARGSHEEEPRVRFMCSYGGRILPRPHDNQLRYVGGDTRIVAVARTIAFSSLTAKLSKLGGSNVTVKYQLPNEDLDALISVTTDEDLENMMEEYDRLNAVNRSSRLRLFLFPAKLENASSLGSLLDGSKREHWFLDALNGLPVLTRRRSEVSSMASEVPDYLFGLDTVDDWDRDETGSKPAAAAAAGGGPGKSRLNSQHVAEAHSAPGSPVPISSPYGSTSSAPPSIDSHIIAELAAKPAKFAFHPAASDVTSELHTQKPVSKPEVASHESAPIAKQDAPVETMNVPSRSAEPMSGSSIATMKREDSASNLSAHGDDGRSRPLPAEEVYNPVAPAVMPPDHYVDYTQAAPQFVQPQAYWQMHEDESGKLYYVAAGAAAPLVQRQAAYVQRIGYGAEPGVVPPPVQKVAGAGSVPGSYGGRVPGKAPLYRGARPVAAMVMRPPVAVAVADQYAYQQVAFEGVVQNGGAQQVYYTQKPTVMNPQYQQAMMGPVGVELQSSPDTMPEGSVMGRVSGSV